MSEENGAVVNQVEAAVESGAQATGGDQADAINESPAVQSEGKADNQQGETIGPEKIPAELAETRKQLLADYHKKTQELANERKALEPLKGESETLRKLMEADWFKQAYAAEKEARQGRVSQVPDEALSNVGLSREAFELVKSSLAKEFEAKYGRQLSSTAQTVENLAMEKEFMTFAKANPDAVDLRERGLLDPYLKKGADYELAYKAAKFDLEKIEGPARTQQKAAEILSAKKAGSVDKGGIPKVTGQRIMQTKGKSLDQILTDLFHAESRGESVKIERE